MENASSKYLGTILGINYYYSWENQKLNVPLQLFEEFICEVISLLEGRIRFEKER